MDRKNVTNFRGEMPRTPNGNIFRIKDEPLTPTDEGFGEHDFFEDVNYNMRKSLSMGDIATIKEELVDFKLNNENKEDVYSRHRKVSCAPALSKTKFVSMAEAVYRYQRDTPERFHSNRPKSCFGQGSSVRSLTRPQSPMLRCKDRARPHHILSQKEKEELEFEEIRKHQIKANPIPKSVIAGSKNLPEVQRKANTVPEPFKLTEVHKKVPSVEEPSVNFKARPAPKHILEKPQIVPVKPLPPPPTKAVSPKFHFKKANPTDNIKSDLKKNEKQPEKCAKSLRQGPLKPEPFSFQKRDEELKRKHEEEIKRRVEEERKLASQFKAQPLPAAVKKRMQCATVGSAASTTSSENKENCNKFEAKPPVVLYKKPFKPVLQSTQIIKPQPFDLATEKRAAEREKFDKLLKEKEEENEKMRQQQEKEQREAEERALAEMRAKLVHHPKPIPSLTPNLPEKPPIVVTVPETPKCLRRKKNN